MSVLFDKNKTELIATCRCGCDDSIHIRIDNEDHYYYAILSYMNGNFYSDQNSTVFRTIGKKLKKIWAIIRNKDYHYSDVFMTKEEFEEFRKFINSVA